MRWMGAASGLLLIAAGTTAAITGQFEGDGSWLLALGLGLVGIVGLINVVASSLARTTTVP